MNKKVVSEYCTGCGLCSSVNNIQLKKTDNGFIFPEINKDTDFIFFSEVCPAGGKHLSKQDNTTWGKYENVYSGYSTDSEIRFKSASGGVTTAIAVYLIEQGIVDGIIQVGECKDNPYCTDNYVSKTRKEIISHCGSRYIVSSPLNNLHQIISSGGKYALIARPCDIATLNNYLELYPQFKDRIYCTLAFFCAGSPSVDASKKLAKKLNINPETVTKIRYRGYGWPGKATVFSGDREEKMDYIDSWNQILGRDIRKICKFCTDGVGEAADISSGDLWNLVDGQPMFDESDGRNVVFSRTEKGENILLDALSKGYIKLDNYSDKIQELSIVQPNHAIRKKMLYPRILGMKLMLKPVPNYNMAKLREYCKDVPSKRIIKSVLGTVKRVIAGKL